MFEGQANLKSHKYPCCSGEGLSKVYPRGSKNESFTDIQMANTCEKMLVVTNYKRNAKQNYNKVPPLTS